MIDLWDKFQYEGNAIVQIIEFIEQIAFWEHLIPFLTPDEAHWLHTAHMDMEMEEHFEPMIVPVVYIE